MFRNHPPALGPRTGCILWVEWVGAASVGLPVEWVVAAAVVALGARRAVGLVEA